MVKKSFACGECSMILPDPEKKKEIPQCNVAQQHKLPPTGRVMSSSWTLKDQKLLRD